MCFCVILKNHVLQAHKTRCSNPPCPQHTLHTHQMDTTSCNKQDSQLALVVKLIYSWTSRPGALEHHTPLYGSLPPLDHSVYFPCSYPFEMQREGESYRSIKPFYLTHLKLHLHEQKILETSLRKCHHTSMDCQQIC